MTFVEARGSQRLALLVVVALLGLGLVVVIPGVLR